LHFSLFIYPISNCIWGARCYPFGDHSSADITDAAPIATNRKFLLVTARTLNESVKNEVETEAGDDAEELEENQDLGGNQESRENSEPVENGEAEEAEDAEA